MSEQVWDRRPPSGSRLARSIHAGRPVETPRLVACRYAEVGSC